MGIAIIMASLTAINRRKLLKIIQNHGAVQSGIKISSDEVMEYSHGRGNSGSSGLITVLK